MYVFNYDAVKYKDISSRIEHSEWYVLQTSFLYATKSSIMADVQTLVDCYLIKAHVAQRTCQDNFSPRNSPLISTLLPQTGTDFAQTARTAFLAYW